MESSWYLIIGIIGILINLVLQLLLQAAEPGPRFKLKWWHYILLVIPFSYLLIPLFLFIISPWKRY